ncbi:MAG: SPOR domain-containing protein [Ignavibacteriae bacterium]|nr:SPOR domain-containing protein [Ignavibacteriota bacterium]MCB9206761.1 SPOR domain-containing protein [Ignavibacteriales bacterium]MCB9210235.1 SPOR domain-containing protein [Ignavibacteriales bacterium]MCB9219030.1 SPOR domain-containing protein [Ignavibacteriales bacterium]MCB9259615.1 SPOR domain-containing protein [Ignavibacteriales bacterium]
MWTNFKTYFNTYYNANKIFTEAEEKILEERKELFAYEEKPINSNISKDLNEVIEKTSAILQHNKESDYVSEALIMTGKSFYYQQNYSRALRKFNELSTIEDSELLLENELWTAKTLLQMREFNKALRLLDEVKTKAIENEENQILIDTYRSKIGYLIYNKEFSSAISEINQFLNAEIDDELRAAVLYEMGLMYKISEEYELAEKAFIEVDEYAPTFEIDFNSKFEVAKLKGELGEEDQSLELLQELRDEDKFSDSWGDIDLEIGKIFYDKNEIDKAFDKFTYVDTTYKSTESGGISGFYRAEILENFYNDYDSALVFYKKTASSGAPQELKLLAQKKSVLLNKYISFHEKLDDLEKQLLYLTDNNSFIQDSLDYVELLKLDSIKAASNPNKNQNSKLNRNQQLNTKYKMPQRPKISADSVHALNSRYYFELANLLFSEFDNPDSAFYYYTLSLQEKENNPNQAQTLFAMGNYYAIKQNKQKADSMFTLVYNKFQFDPIRNEAAKQIGKPLYDFNKDPVEEEYIVAEAIYDSLKYQKAINRLFDIYKENPKSIYASKSLYTIGFILENDLKMPDSAASVYDRLMNEYKTSEYAKSIQNKLGGYKQEQQRLQAIQDSINNTNSSQNITGVEETIISSEANLEIDDSIKTSINNSTETDDSTSTNKTIQEKINKNVVSKSDNEQIISRDIFKIGNEYFVQVSSWKSKEIAEEELGKLIKKKYSGKIIESFVEELNAVYYRIRLGPYDNFNSAKDVRKKINKY